MTRGLRFVLQECGNSLEGSDWWHYLMEHIGRNATNYFMYQWAGACLPPGGRIRVQAAPASELILYIGPHLTPD